MASERGLQIETEQPSMDCQRNRRGRAVVVVCLSFGAACTGQIGPEDVPASDGPMGIGAGGVMGNGGASGVSRAAGPEDPYAIGPSGLRRLSRTEYDNALRDLLGDTTRSGWAKLPEDSFTPFDNDYTKQVASGVLVETVDALAEEAATRALGDPARAAALFGCTPTGPDDAACMRSFIKSFGRRALRRPLTDDEVSRYLALQKFSVEDRSFLTGAALVIRVLRQDPEFAYPVDIGEPVRGVAGVLKLNDFEVASRLSFFLLGAPPPPSLLVAAESGALGTAAGRRAAAAKLLEDPRAKAQIG